MGGADTCRQPLPRRWRGEEGRGQGLLFHVGQSRRQGKRRELTGAPTVCVHNKPVDVPVKKLSRLLLRVLLRLGVNAF